MLSDGDSIIEHLNVFIQLLSIDIKITKEDKCISLFCSFPNSLDIWVMSIGRNNTTLKIDDVIASLLSK